MDYLASVCIFIWFASLVNDSEGSLKIPEHLIQKMAKEGTQICLLDWVLNFYHIEYWKTLNIITSDKTREHYLITVKNIWRTPKYLLSPTYGPRSTTGPQPIVNRAAWVAGWCVCVRTAPLMQVSWGLVAPLAWALWELGAPLTWASQETLI